LLKIGETPSHQKVAGVEKDVQTGRNRKLLALEERVAGVKRENRTPAFQLYLRAYHKVFGEAQDLPYRVVL